jgi:hypothetical protein
LVLAKVAPLGGRTPTQGLKYWGGHQADIIL